MVRAVTRLAVGGLLVLTAVGCGERREVPPPAAVPPPASAHHAVAVTWHDDWERAVAAARAEGRPLLVNFYADWCVWCARLEATTLKDSDVAALLASRVVAVRQQIDGGGQQRALSLRVEAPPTLVVLDVDGRERGRILGYLPPSAFLAELQRILGP